MRTRPSSPIRRGRRFGMRSLGWLAVASMLALSIIGPGTGVALGATEGWAGNGWPVKETARTLRPARRSGSGPATARPH